MSRTREHLSPIEGLGRPVTVAILGSGGREHALAVKIAESPLCKKVLVLPGNPGMTAEKIGVKEADLSDLEGLAATLLDLDAGLVVVGPDNLLAAGVVDVFEKGGMVVFGPTRAAARIEWSKSFAKEIMTEAGVPHAGFRALSAFDPDALDAAAAALGGFPLVLKFDGLALGKGVSVCDSREEALGFLQQVFEGKRFGSAPPVVLCERFLTGHEVSFFAITDGECWTLLEPACDHKRLLDGNRGPNTGGMGAFSPVPWLSPEKRRGIAERIFPPVLTQLRKARATFRGLLYAGLMVNRDDFWVLEFNARFGDPETQAVLPRMESDLLPLLFGAATRKLELALDTHPPRWKPDACVNVVAASRGYPEKPETEFEISGVADAERAGARVYFAGVKGRGESLRTAGGRVLGVSALGPGLEVAAGKALKAMEKIRFEGMQYRHDIGRIGLDV